VTSEGVNALRVFERSFVRNVLVPPHPKKNFCVINVDMQEFREIYKIA
jgi:hypothetical protein